MSCGNGRYIVTAVKLMYDSTNFRHIIQMNSYTHTHTHTHIHRKNLICILIIWVMKILVLSVLPIFWKNHVLIICYQGKNCEVIPSPCPSLVLGVRYVISNSLMTWDLRRNYCICIIWRTGDIQKHIVNECYCSAFELAPRKCLLEVMSHLLRTSSACAHF